VIDEAGVAELKTALRQKLDAQISERRSAEEESGSAVNSRRLLDETVERMTVELQEQQDECLSRNEDEAARLFQAMREKLLPQVASEIAENLPD
jgi:hypothetical protein